jgi:1-phosphatidylinositol phosphodiesterase
MTDLANWMSRLASANKLSALSIPGTHDSGTAFPASERDRLMTQSRTIAEQLADGIRFLDIRVQYKNDRFFLVHEDTELNSGPESDAAALRFGPLQDLIKEFLRTHPRETIILSLKQDADPENNTGNLSFQQKFDEFVTAAPGLWFLENEIPTLGQVRGKIVLFRRFDAEGELGIKAQPFVNNETKTLTGPPELRIQDYFDQTGAGSRKDKWGRIEALLNEASNPLIDPGRAVLYLNFGSGAGIIANDYPKKVAKFINPKFVTYFTAHPRGRFGIVITDFEEASLNTQIVQTNETVTGGYWIVDTHANVAGLGFSSAYPLSTAASTRAGATNTAATDAVAMAATPDGLGYYLLSFDGTVHAYGRARHAGDGVPKGKKAQAIAVNPRATSTGDYGYWVLARNGKVRAYDAPDHGQIESGTNLQATSIVATPDGGGYWILASNGRVHHFGNARVLPDRRDSDQTNVAMARTPDGGGYWILTNRGRVHAFGNAVYYGQGVDSGSEAYAIAPTRDGTGYWILSTDGKVKAYGSAATLGGVPAPGSVVAPGRTAGQAAGIAADLFAPAFS